jgi:hypothetical protein
MFLSRYPERLSGFFIPMHYLPDFGYLKAKRCPQGPVYKITG